MPVKPPYIALPDYTCPMGCPKGSLVLKVNRIVCKDDLCGDPLVVHTLMTTITTESQHLVQINTDRTFTVQHPIHERIRGTLFSCDEPRKLDWMVRAGAHKPGVYRWLPFPVDSDAYQRAPGRLEKVT